MGRLITKVNNISCQIKMATNYIVKNFKERLYTIIIYFKKGENNEKLFNFLKSEIKEEGGSWIGNKYSFMSKETLFDLQKNSNHCLIILLILVNIIVFET